MGVFLNLYNYYTKKILKNQQKPLDGQLAAATETPWVSEFTQGG